MPEDTLRVMCPNLTCRKILAVPASARGKTVRCRGCATSIRIPNTKTPDAPPKPETAAATVQAQPAAAKPPAPKPAA